MADTVVRPSNQCAERQALIDQIRNTIDRTNAIHNEELQDTLTGEHPSSQSYADRLRESRAHRVLLIEKLGRHVGEHGC